MPGTEHGQSLAGYSVWVTRPAHQSKSIIRSLKQHGAQVLAVPLLEIAPYDEPASQQHLAQADGYDAVIFVSVNAVTFSVNHHQTIANVLDLAVIGQATADKCRECGLKVQFIPEQADSDGLLALPRFQHVDGQKILIVRGHGGREHLAEQLRARGATVDYAEVYQRRVPAIHLNVELAAADVILITSSEALQNLVMLAQRDRQGWVFERQLLLIHARIASRVAESGFTLRPLVATEASDSGMIAALLDGVRSRRSKAT